MLVKQEIEEMTMRSPELASMIGGYGSLRKGRSGSVDTIERRSIPWQEEAVIGKLRFKLLRLGEDTRQERRYFEPDVEALLVRP